MRERKSDLRPRRENTLPPQKLYVILRNIYPKDVADEMYKDATGLEPPEGEPERRQGYAGNKTG